MTIIPDSSQEKKTSKPTMEMVEQEKQEYKLIGKYLRTRGLRLFAYDPIHKELSEVEIRTKDAINIIVDPETDELIPKDLGLEECTVHSADVHFEALNPKSAERRLKKYQDGKLKELCNLRVATGEGIKFW